MQRSDHNPAASESSPVDSERVAPRNFADELIGRLRRLGHPLCVGIDPHLARIPALFRQGPMKPDDPRTTAAMEDFCRAMIGRVAGRVAIVKPQVAFFERLGWRGWRALEAVITEARRLGLLVLLDAKRSDIGSTAQAYADAYLDPAGALPVDAVTLNPYLGRDSLEPFVISARAAGRGLFALVRTSNRDAADL